MVHISYIRHNHLLNPGYIKQNYFKPILNIDLYGEHMPEERSIRSKIYLNLSAGSTYTRVYTVLLNVNLGGDGSAVTLCHWFGMISYVASDPEWICCKKKERFIKWCDTVLAVITKPGV